ncbi:ribosome small subunit-dependent GTPase A [Eubacteriales bacterium OttesenSCG-928-M02]|nr:ribosome small subunit-dependent GTPase A [Eubacteriales bacterium OttesenSCG-928-M02]
MKTTVLENYGYDPINFLGYEMDGLFPGRVISQGREQYRVVSEKGEAWATLGGRFRHDATGALGYPCVGDFVLLQWADGTAIIHQVLPRKSLFTRRMAGSEHQVQAVCANMDIAFLVMALNEDFSIRRMERYLALAWDSGATPIIVLTKMDLAPDLAGQLMEIEAVAMGVEVIPTTIEDTNTFAAIGEKLSGTKTGCFLGSSGVGKSTLINGLLGEERIATGDIREDGKGRHTTTRRELLVLENGGLVIDTPGMREVGMDTGDMGKAFSDIEALSERCRFRDCTHKVEPGCAVLAAVAEGSISPQRLESYHRLCREMGYEGLDARQREQKKLDEMFREVGGRKNFRKSMREADKRKQ